MLPEGIELSTSPLPRVCAGDAQGSVLASKIEGFRYSGTERMPTCHRLVTNFLAFPICNSITLSLVSSILVRNASPTFLASSATSE